MSFVYILRCADGSFYVGKTNDLHTRLTEHQSGVGADYTAVRRPVDMVYAEEHSTIGSAKAREMQLKRSRKCPRPALRAGAVNARRTSRRRTRTCGAARDPDDREKDVERDRDSRKDDPRDAFVEGARRRYRSRRGRVGQRNRADQNRLASPSPSNGSNSHKPKEPTKQLCEARTSAAIHDRVSSGDVGWEPFL